MFSVSPSTGGGCAWPGPARAMSGVRFGPRWPASRSSLVSLHMRLSDRSPAFRWSGALALAWATSGLVLVGEGQEALVQLVVLAAWGSYTWRCTPLRVRAAARRAVACALIVAVPLQSMAAAERQARGPAHFHADASSHFHADARHHHHAAADNAILLDTQEHREAASVIAESRYGALDAATFAGQAAAPALHADEIRDRSLLGFVTPFLPIPERPPRA
jgi:hypothetical protein